MKFVYHYRTRENEQRSGEISASSRDAAYAALKARGIRPSRVDEAPGILNKLLGRGKRWLAIAALALLALASILYARRTTALAQPSDWEVRSQLYGDPIVIGECEASGWRNVLPTPFDCQLARYAIPGRLTSSTTGNGAIAASSLQAAVTGRFAVTTPIHISTNDLAEVVKMKRMVNGMKRELADYLAAGGTLSGYLRRLEIRQRAEHGYYLTAKQQAAREPAAWRRINAELRAMGLPLLDPPEETTARESFPAPSSPSTP